MSVLYNTIISETQKLFLGFRVFMEIGMSKSDKISKKILENLGFEPKKIPESNKEECDYLITLGNNNYLIEAKLREDNPENLLKFNQDMQNQGFANSGELILGRDKNTENIIKKAKKQLNSTAGDNEQYFKILLIMIDDDCLNKNAKFEQVYSTLLGKKDLIIVGKKIVKKCYFFEYSAFCNYKDIDGAIIVFLDISNNNRFSLSFVLNNFSKNIHRLEQSEIMQYFDALEIYNPFNDKNVLSIDESFYRENKNPTDYEKICFIQEKYKIDEKIIPCDFKSVRSSFVVVDKEKP